MNPEIRPEDEDWDGVEQREVRRRYTIDRRTLEKRKRYWWSVIFPIILGCLLTGIMSWGVYVTHVTYRISANYETTFVKHIGAQIEKDAAINHRLELMKADYTTRMTQMRSDMADGLKEIRNMQGTMYRLLLDSEKLRKKGELKTE